MGFFNKFKNNKTILDLNQEKEEQEKREKYNPNDIFKNRHKQENRDIEITKNNTQLNFFLQNSKNLYLNYYI